MDSDSLIRISRLNTIATSSVKSPTPWVTDVEAEMARLQKEKEEAMAQAQEYAGAFQTGNQNKGDNGEGE